MDATTVAVDLAKTVFEVAIADRHWHIVARHRFTRRQFTKFLATTSATHVVMEACGTAHYWGAARKATVTRSRCCHRPTCGRTCVAIRPTAPTRRPCSKRCARGRFRPVPVKTRGPADAGRTPPHS